MGLRGGIALGRAYTEASLPTVRLWAEQMLSQYTSGKLPSCQDLEILPIER